MKDVWVEKIDDLINDFPDDRYVELLEELIDRAQSALAARKEESKDDE